MGRFRAVQCLTTLTALPYSRLHPFKTQVRYIPAQTVQDFAPICATKTLQLGLVSELAIVNVRRV